MSPDQIAAFLTSGDYYFVLAAFVYIVVLGLDKLTPDTVFTQIWQKRLAAAAISIATPVLSVLPAGLIAHFTPLHLLSLALAAFFGSTLIHKLLTPRTTVANVTNVAGGPPATGDDKPKTGDVLVVTDTPTKPTIANRLRLTALAFGMVFVAMTLSGCAALSAALPGIVKVITDVTDASMILDQIASFVNTYFAAHPDAAKQKAIDTALTTTREALVVAQRTAAGAEALDQNQTDAAFADFRADYDALTQLLSGIDGLHLAKPGESLQAASGELVIPAPLALTTQVAK